MTVLLDASVGLRWFVEQPGYEEAMRWLARFESEPDLFLAPDLFVFELHGGLARQQSRREPGWAERCLRAVDRLGIPTLPTSLELFERALVLSRELRIGGYDAVYLAHAESIGAPWLTADEKAVRRLAGDRRVQPLLR